MFLTNLKLPAIALAVVLAAGIGVWLRPRGEEKQAAGWYGVSTDKATPSNNELEQLEGTNSSCRSRVQNARKRLNDLDGQISAQSQRNSGGPTGRACSSAAPSRCRQKKLGNRPNKYCERSESGASDGIGKQLHFPQSLGTVPGMPATGSGGGPPSMSGAPADRLCRIEQQAEELRKKKSRHCGGNRGQQLACTNSDEVSSAAATLGRLGAGVPSGPASAALVIGRTVHQAAKNSSKFVAKTADKSSSGTRRRRAADHAAHRRCSRA